MFLQKLLFIFLLLAFSLGEVARISFSNNIAIIGIDILVGLLSGYWILRQIFQRRISQNSLKKPLLFFIGTAVLSLVVNIFNYQLDELFVAGLYLIRWIAYATLYFVILELPVAFKKIITWGMVVAGTIITLVGYVQYFLYPDLRNLMYAGWDEHLYRMFSVFLDPNFAGAFFVLLFLLVSGLFYEAYQKKDWRKIQVFGPLLVFVFCAIFLTYSRSGLFMLVTSVSMLLLIIKKKRLLFGLFIFATIFFLLLSKSLQSEGTNMFRTTSSNARVLAMQQAAIIIQENPIFGVGFNAYRYAQEKHGFIDSDQEKPNHAGAGTDNSFLFVLATTGIFGFVAYAYLLVNILMYAYKSHARGNIIGLVLFCSLVGLIVNSFFINSLFYPFLMAWVWILAGITESE